MREENRPDYGYGPTRIRHYESPAEYAACCPSPYDGGPSWNGEGVQAALKHARSGRLDMVERAERVLEQINKQIDALRGEWIPSRAGAYVVVPEFLTGFPESMRRRVEAPNERAPIRFYVDVWAACFFSADALINRGVSFLALAMALLQDRPVEMYAMVTGSGSGRNAVDMIPLPTSPLDLAVVCSVFFPSFLRCIGFGYMQKYTENSCPPLWRLYAETPADRDTYVKRMRALLCANDTDVIVGPTWRDDLSNRDPIAFVNKAIQDHLTLAE